MKFHRWDLRDKERVFCLEHHQHHQHLSTNYIPLGFRDGFRLTPNVERDQLFADHAALYQLGQFHRSQAALGHPKHDALERDANQRSEAVWRQLVAM
jgi:hypothetical protein